MQPRTAWRWFALLAASIALAGCATGGFVPSSGDSLGVTAQAKVVFRSEESADHVVSVTTRVGGSIVDSNAVDVPGNGTAALLVGIPTRGNVMFRVTGTNGGSMEQTLSVGSCSDVRMTYVMRAGLIQGLETRC